MVNFVSSPKSAVDSYAKYCQMLSFVFQDHVIDFFKPDGCKAYQTNRSHQAHPSDSLVQPNFRNKVRLFWTGSLRGRYQNFVAISRFRIAQAQQKLSWLCSTVR